uniref:GT23 domain-containing protein n=1 Tax=Ciona savignyi TaxID=51511 RepID=H2ZE68_CIOSA
FDYQTKDLIKNAMKKTTQLVELFRHQSERLGQMKPNATKSILAHFKRLSGPLENSLINDLEILRNLSAKEDSEEIQKLNDIAQNIIHTSQNPKNCQKANKLHCSMKHTSCGFGCIVHMYEICMFVAVGEARSMQYDLNQLIAYPGINATFKYPSDTCVNRTNFAKSLEKMQLHRKMKLSPSPLTEHLAVTHASWIPDKLLPRIKRVHTPSAWWTGQVVSYIVRLQKQVKSKLKKAKEKIKFAHPIAGIHVRRRDKIGEAYFLDLERYMDHVESWYDQYMLQHPEERVIRRVYLATDDAELVKSANTKYPEYQFITYVSDYMLNVVNRNSDSAINGILFDTFLLKECDFVVVTFSSNIGRLVYQLRQTLPMDPSFNTISLDDRHSYCGEKGQHHVAIMDHNPPSFIKCNDTQHRSNTKVMRSWTCELELKIGDKIQKIPFLHHEYLTGGYNRRTFLHGLYPAHKAKDILIPAPYPTFGL